MKLTVDCELTSQLSALQHDSALACLISKANKTWEDSCLEALICHQHGLSAVPDYPMAAMAANVDGLEVADAYWLRADPVNLIMQRDSLSLSEPVPIQMEANQAESLLASLNQHFSAEGLVFFIGNSGAWYLRLQQIPEVITTLPSVAVGKNVYQFMPQGVLAAKWRSYLNEAQMLLFTHPVNAARELAGLPVINSLWLSGGGMMPQRTKFKNNVDLMIENSVFYRGLAQWAGLQSLPNAMKLADAIQNMAPNQHVRMQLSAEHSISDAGFQVLLKALKTKKINELTLNLGCYEKTLVLTLTTLDTYKFWRKLKPVMHFLA